MLNNDASNVQAYLGKLMVELHTHKKEELKNCSKPLEKSKHYNKVLRFSDAELSKELNECNEFIKKRNLYNDVLKEMDMADSEEEYNAVAEKFKFFSGYENADILMEKCLEQAIKCREYEDFYSPGKEGYIRAYNNNLIAKNMIKIGGGQIVGLKSDGTVVATGSNYHGECNVDRWRDIIAISANRELTVGLKSDGTVVAIGDNRNDQCVVSDWKNIIAIVTSGAHTVGLKSDGTVVATGSNYFGQCDVGNWKDIIAVAKGSHHTVGLKSDGTVVAIGNNKKFQCIVGDWKNIIAIATSDAHTVGLKSDGTVVATGSNVYGQCDVKDWKNIVAISTSYYHTVGLKSDGTVVATKYKSIIEKEEAEKHYDVSDWKNIIAVDAGYYYTVGLKSDGTVVVTSDEKITDFKASDWKLFQSIDTLDDELAKAQEERLITKAKAGLASLENEKNLLQTELSNLKGFFTGNRRKEIEKRLAEIDKEIEQIKSTKLPRQTNRTCINE